MRAERKEYLKNKKVLSKSDKTARLLVPMLFSMVLCSCLFVGATWAWFTDSVSNTVLPTNSGKWAVSLKITDSNNNEIVVDMLDNSYVASLEANKKYNVVLVPKEDNNSQGLCYVTFDGKTYYTSKIFKDSYELTIDTTGAIDNVGIRVFPKWGNAANDPSWQLLEKGTSLIVQKVETTTKAPNEKPVQNDKPSVDNNPTATTVAETTTQATTVPNKKEEESVNNETIIVESTTNIVEQEINN